MAGCDPNPGVATYGGPGGRRPPPWDQPRGSSEVLPARGAAGFRQQRLTGRRLRLPPLLLLCLVTVVCGASSRDGRGSRSSVSFVDERPLRYLDQSSICQKRYHEAILNFSRGLRSNALHPVSPMEYRGTLELYINEMYKKIGGGSVRRLLRLTQLVSGSGRC